MIDIGPLDRREFDVEGLKVFVTPRDPLKEIVVELLEHNPLCIGIDIDFSPDESKDKDGKKIWSYKHPKDGEWMRNLAKQAADKDVPIFFGVGRGRWRDAEGWLGDLELMDNAACIFLYDERDRRKIPWGFKAEHGTATLPGMGAALGRRLRPAVPADGHEGGWLLETFTGFDAPDLSHPQAPPYGQVTEFLIDFGPMQALMNNRVRRAITAETIKSNEEIIDGKVVILGRVRRGEATDTFNIWYINRAPVAGVFLHACAALTPGFGWLREFTHTGRLLIDIGISGALLFIVTILCCYYKHRYPGERVNARAGHVLFTFLAICLVVVGGYSLARYANIMWTDFLLVALALALHRPVHAFFIRGKDLLQRIINEIFLGKEPAE